MADSDSSSSRWGTLIAILIACVTVFGAIIAWRISVASSDASTADTSGLLAFVEKERAYTRANNTLMGHLNAYTAYFRNTILADTYSALAALYPDRKDFSATASALRSAANYANYMIPPKFMDRDKKLDVNRDLGENIAQESISKDVNPGPHFANADESREKAEWLVTIMILLGFSLLFLTLADAIRNPLRYFLLLAGVGVFGLGILIALVIEFLGIPHIRIS